MLELIIKPRCVHCKSDADIQFGLCRPCRESLTAYNPPSRCKNCGLAIQGEGTICQRCFEAEDSFDRAFFLFPYEKAGRTLIHHIKFRDRPEWLDILDDAGDVWLSVLAQWKPDAVCGIPSSLHTRWYRGYNVSEKLAGKVADALGVPCVRLLKRARLFKRRLSATRTPAERRRVIRRFLKRADTVPERFSHVLIVDDVFTTGATVNRGAKLLKQIPTVSEISVFTLARVGE